MSGADVNGEAPFAGIPSLLETPRLILRAFDASDAEPFDALVMSSIDHLLPWEPWAADEPRPMAQRRVDLDKLGADLRAGTAAHYAITLPGCGMLLGSAALVLGPSRDSVEIGYWLGVTHTGLGYASEAVSALTWVALDFLGLEQVEICVDENNASSNALARRLGYEFERRQPARAYPGEPPLPEPVPTMNVWIAHRGWKRPDLRAREDAR